MVGHRKSIQFYAYSVSSVSGAYYYHLDAYDEHDGSQERFSCVITDKDGPVLYSFRTRDGDKSMTPIHESRTHVSIDLSSFQMALLHSQYVDASR